MMDIFKEAQLRQINYEKVISRCLVKRANWEHIDISIIIPVRDRTEFNHIVSNHFEVAIFADLSIKVTLTFVEHSDTPKHMGLCYPWVNYIWIPAQGERFNKCLCHNVGAIIMNQATAFMFHDTDIVVQEDFFKNLMLNTSPFTGSMQTFTKRRLLQCSEIVTREIFEGKNDIRTLQKINGGVNPGEAGASGGSMYVRRANFFMVGGFDPDFFSEYSVEDQFFFDKLSVLEQVGFADKPPIEQYHLYHPPSFNRTTKDSDWDALNSFNALSSALKTDFVNLKSRLFRGGLNGIAQLIF